MCHVNEMLRIKESSKVQLRARKAVVVLRRRYPGVVQLGVSNWLGPDDDV